MESYSDFPFRTEISLDPLVRFWQETVSPCCDHMSDMAHGVMSQLAEIPELQGNLKKPSVIGEHIELIQPLLNAIFPVASQDTEIGSLMRPFSLEPFYATPAALRYMSIEHFDFAGMMAGGESAAVKRITLEAYLLILDRLYGIKQSFDHPFIWRVTDPDTGLDRYMRLDGDLRFVDVAIEDKLKKLTKSEQAEIIENITDIRVLQHILPPEKFILSGFTVIHAVDITETYTISRLERKLIEKNASLTPATFDAIRDNLRILFRYPDLDFGLAGIQDDQVMILNPVKETDPDSEECVFSNSRRLPVSMFDDSIYKQAYEGYGIIRLGDLTEVADLAEVDTKLLDYGVRSIMLTPLIYEGQAIGTMDIGSPNPYEFSPMDALLLEQVAPVMTIAVKMGLASLDNQIQNIVKTKATALHPAVEWRFVQEAYGHLDRQLVGKPSEMEPIVFRDVYPIYGASDIRGSSEARNKAILTDLNQHLALAKEVVNWAAQAKPWPLLQEMTHLIDRQLGRLDSGLLTDDETSVVGFIHKQIEPVFPQLMDLGPRVVKAVKNYNKNVDPTLGTVYRKRREFENSVIMLNERISAYIDHEETAAQDIFPHYFEKRQTDGLDYVIYIGQSMVESGNFNKFFVSNLRLWQLMVACGIAWHTAQLKPLLQIPLDTCHLILCNHTPLSIRFRYDEKRFDVDGAYDVRYEIIKSRIDKAVVKGTKERLTQPDQIAVVYSTLEEAEEMERHIDFLTSQGYLEKGMETLSLEDLPGVRGLKAFRAKVNVKAETVTKRAQMMVG